MGLNCRKGDLAYIVAKPWQNHFVTVLYWEANERHTLPDGYGGLSNGQPGWVVEKCSGVFTAPLANGGRRETKYSLVQDQYLRPIRDQPGEDETLRYAGKPAPVVRKLTEPEFDAAVKSWEKA